MVKDFIEIVQRTMGSHLVMFVGPESGEGQIKLVVFETAPGDGKMVFTESSQSRKDWVLTAESILTDYLLTEPGEWRVLPINIFMPIDHCLWEEDSPEKQEVEISLDEDGNPEVPTWGGQKLNVQQNLARAVFQAAYAKFTKKPKAKVLWGLLIKSPMKYLDTESIPEGFTMKDPSKWTKADLGLLQDHWQSLEAQDEVIVSFIDCKKEDAPLSRQFDRKVVGSREATTDAGQSNPEESSPAWHASKDQISYLKSLSIMPRYQVLVDLVDALPEQEHGKGLEVDFPYWTTWHGAIGELQCARFSSSLRGLDVVLGLGLLLRECSLAQEVEEDDPMVMGVVVSRLEQCPAGTKGPQGGDGGAGLDHSDRGDEEKEKEEEEEEKEEEAPPRKRKRAGSGIVTRGQKMAKDEGKGKKVEENQRKGVRTQNQTKRAM
ncbi:hypothetical protein EDD17DRAFT_1768482 [Pisolithus thermaeus]|nr:hypothetical protein EDD17DRAFT_1768482 [Pisolithus thermaeus]